MKFNFPPANIERFSDIIGKLAAKRFLSTKGNVENKIWVRNVLELFAEKGHLTFSQAVQTIKSDSLEATRLIHKRYGESLPEYVMSVDDSGAPIRIRNPERNKFMGFADMAPHDHKAMMRGALSFAASIRHPSDPTPKEKPSKPDVVAKVRSGFHPDQSLHAHRQRCGLALLAFVEANGEQYLMDKVERALAAE